MNRIESLFIKPHHPVLNVYFTAGYPNLADTPTIIRHLVTAGVDMIEIGLPYSDPIADGLTIQKSSQQALSNGMTLDLLFQQVKEVRASVSVPLILMGYYNQMLQYGPERFLQTAASVGIDGLIIPDLPMDIFEEEYASLFKVFDMGICFLITPQTSDERIIQADRLSTGFIYVVSKSSITGDSGEISAAQKTYFQKITSFKLKRPRLIGFGIHDHTTFELACSHADGAIIGSAFIRALEGEGTLSQNVSRFIGSIRKKA